MTDVAVDTLRLRGPHARRLAAVAARTLPAALDRALAGFDDVRMDEVVVRLDLDVAAYDDETLAVLWADAIRARLLDVRWKSARGAAIRPEGRASPAAPAAEPPEVLADLRAFAAAGCGGPVPRSAAALADAATRRAVAEAAGPGTWAALLRVLTRALSAQPAWPAGPVPEASGDCAHGLLPRPFPVTGAVPVSEEAGADAKAGQKRPPSGFETLPDAPAGSSERPDAVLDDLAALAGSAAVPGQGADGAVLTRAAGLVLLYPWLTEHCRRAEGLHPDLDAVDVREAALAAVADPGDPAWTADPLVALLAGRAAPEPDRFRRPLLRHDEVAESATGVLLSFAALLPGFERSSPGFVRASWIIRPGVLNSEREPVPLIAATRPLDVVLTRLPYPVGLVKLPWSPPLTVRLRP